MKYRFLNHVYVTRDGENVAYELVESDSHFSQASIRRVTLDGLKQLAEEQFGEKDFVFKDGFLRCSDVGRVLMTKEIEKTVTGDVLVSEDYFDNNNSYALFDLLRTGIENGFVFLNDGIVLTEDWCGEGIVPFSKIQFSQSTMSVYYREVFDGTLKNVHIVKSEWNAFSFVPFYFGVPEECKIYLPYKLIKNSTINNKKYSVYRAENCSIMRAGGVLAPPALINKAACLRVRLASALTAVKCLRDSCYDNTNKVPLKWVGDPDRKPVTTVSFKASYKAITPKDAVKLISTVKEICRGKSFQEAREAIRARDLTVVGSFVEQWLASVFCRSNNVADIITNCSYGVEQLSAELFYADVYLYRVRAYMCKNNSNVFGRRCLTGSNEPGVTTVEEVFCNE